MDGKPAASVERETFPEEVERVGEDPARWLDRDVLEDGDAGPLIASRIRGIRSIEVIEAWVRVEQELDRPTRTGILDRLKARADELREAEPVELSVARARERETETVASNGVFLDEDGEELSERQRRTFSTSALSQSAEAYKERHGIGSDSAGDADAADSNTSDEGATDDEPSTEVPA